LRDHRGATRRNRMRLVFRRCGHLPPMMDVTALPVANQDNLRRALRSKNI
jgi:hypothetical protein